MNYCAQCGQELVPNANFCRKCGFATRNNGVQRTDIGQTVDALGGFFYRLIRNTAIILAIICALGLLMVLGGSK